MIRRMLILLLCCAHPGKAAESMRVQIVAIAAPQQQTTAAALKSAPDEDARLFDEMAALVAAGEAKILSDQMLCATSLRRVEGFARKEFPYPTEFDPPSEPLGLAQPNAFAFRTLGTSASAQMHPVGRNLVAVEWRRTHFAEWRKFTVPEHWPKAAIPQPQFLNETVTGLLRSDRREWQLCGLAVEAVAVNAPAPQTPRSVFVFARVLRPLKVERAQIPPSRLHSITVELPSEVGLPLLLEEETTVERQLTKALELTAAGRATLREHTACTFTADAPGSAATIVEYPWATSFRNFHSSFVFDNLGVQLDVAKGTGESKTLEAAHEHHSIDVEEIRLCPQPERASWRQPVFQSWQLERIPPPAPGQMLLAGASLDRHRKDGPVLVLTFLKTAGANSGPAALPVAHLILLTLPAVEGARLKALSPEKAAAELTRLAAEPESVLAWHIAPIAPHSAPTAALHRLVPSLLGGKASADPHSPLLYADSISYDCRGFLTLFPATSNTPAQLSFSTGLNEPGMPTLEELRTAATQQTRLPEFRKHGLGLQKLLPATPGATLLQLAPAEVPAGHAEHGRWHAALFIRKQ